MTVSPFVYDESIYDLPERYIIEDELNGTEIVITGEEIMEEAIKVTGFTKEELLYSSEEKNEALKRIYDKKIKEKTKMQKDISDNL